MFTNNNQDRQSEFTFRPLQLLRTRRLLCQPLSYCACLFVCLFIRLSFCIFVVHSSVGQAICLSVFLFVVHSSVGQSVCLSVFSSFIRLSVCLQVGSLVLSVCPSVDCFPAMPTRGNGGELRAGQKREAIYGSRQDAQNVFSVERFQ